MEMNASNILWFLAFIFLMGGGNGFLGYGNRGMMAPPPATQAELTAGLNNQTIMTELNQLGLATQQNNYETARLFSDQNLMMQTQNSANQISVIQGFNQVMAKLDSINANIESCCCKLQTQMLQYRLDDVNAKIVSQQAELSNNAQTQYLMSQWGKWVMNAPAAASA